MSVFSVSPPSRRANDGFDGAPLRAVVGHGGSNEAWKEAVAILYLARETQQQRMVHDAEDGWGMRDSA